MFFSKRVRTFTGYSLPLEVVQCSTRSFLPFTGTKSSGRNTRASKSKTSATLYLSQYISSPEVCDSLRLEPTCNTCNTPSGEITPIRDSFKFNSLSISVHQPSDVWSKAASSAKSSRNIFDCDPPNSSKPPNVNTFPSMQANTWL